MDSKIEHFMLSDFCDESTSDEIITVNVDTGVSGTTSFPLVKIN
jgi:hypothetical protein